jgi:hypothetical protein
MPMALALIGLIALRNISVMSQSVDEVAVTKNQGLTLTC